MTNFNFLYNFGNFRLIRAFKVVRFKPGWDLICSAFALLFVAIRLSAYQLPHAHSDFSLNQHEDHTMTRQLSLYALAVSFCIGTVSHAAVYDNVYWVGGSGEWTGDVGATPSYATGHWSTDPNAATGLPAKFVLGRNDGIRVGQTIGAGGYDLDRLPCDSAAACTTTPPVSISGGTQLGTDIYINNGSTVFYNPNRQLLPGDDGQDRFGDWRIQPNASFPGTPTLNLSNGSKFVHQTTAGGDPDGMWTRWNGAELNIDNATFERTGDRDNGFSGGAFMLASYHGYDHSVQTINIKNGGKLINEGQMWFGVSSFDLLGDNAAGIRVVMTINNGDVNLSGGDDWELDNDGLPLRADLAFIYGRKPNGDADLTDDETYIINFTGPGSITVNGDAANSLDGDTTTGGGGIRVARQTGTTHQIVINGNPKDVADYVGRDEQKSYQDLWNLGILRANNLSGLTGANFNDFFSVTNSPGQNGYKLTSLLAATAPSLTGDFNQNGVVDAADYVIWRDTVGSTTDLRADADGSLQVDNIDLMRWREHFGQTATGSGLGAGAGVPEPSSIVMVLMGVAALASRRRAA